MNTSIIIPCYNSAETLDLQLESLSLQKGCSPFEVIVVDNCSTDGSRQVAEGWKNKISIRVVDAMEHSGVSYARNRGIAEARGEKLIFLDADDAVTKEYVSHCQRSLDEVPLVVCGFDPVDSGEFAQGLEHVLALVSPGALEYRSPLPSEVSPNWPLLPGGSFAARKDVMLTVGGFDLSMEPGAEDNDLAFRLVRAGYELKVQRSATIAYRVNNLQRPFVVYFRRAKSTALLAERYDKWSYGQFAGRPPLVSLVKTFGAGVKILLTNPRLIRSWLPRLAMDSGATFGWFQYHIFKRVPKPRVGFGMI